jgi:hypothetical protein
MRSPLSEEAIMLYVALSSFVLAVVLIGLDVTGVTHGAGGVINALLTLSFVSLAGKAVQVFGHHH